MYQKLRKIALKPVWFHLVFWAASFYVLLNIFASSSEFFKIDYIYTGIFLGSITIPVYLNLFFLLPHYLSKRKHIAFSLLVLANLLFFSYFNHLLFNTLIDYILPGYYFISYYSFFDIVKFFASFFMLTILLQLTREWFQLNEVKSKMVLLQKEKADAELKALSYQVNPHFLFNSLNVLYSLAISKSEKTPEAVINLSDLLRYVIYESNSERVDLGSEISLMKKYIELQRYRIDKNANIAFETDVPHEHVKVAPMLFLPLLENSFKHGIKKDSANAYLKIYLKSNYDSLTFVIENNRAESNNEDHLSPGGVGLVNIQNRLKLIYPDKHQFKIEDHAKYFKIEMHIDLT